MIALEGKTILALAPHIDDVELGAGGTVYRLAQRDHVYYVGLCIPLGVEREEYLKEFASAAAALRIDPERRIVREFPDRDMFSTRGPIRQLLWDLGRELRPDLVFAPSSRDINQDHEVVFAEARRVFKHTTILGYEQPWNNMESGGSLFVRLEQEDIDAKIRAVSAYRSQQQRPFFNNEILLDLARLRGKQVGAPYAECFEVIRMIA